MGLTETLRLVIDGTSKGAQKALGDLDEKAKDSDDKLSRFGKGMDTAANYAAGAATVLTGVIVKSVADTTARGSAIKELMRMTGDSVEEASLLAGQWDATGLSVEEGSVAMKKFSQNLAAVYSGTAKTDPFAELGISVTDTNGQMRDSAAVLSDVREAMAGMENSTLRTDASVQLFGKSGDDLLSWLTKTPAELDEINSKLKDAGLVWGDEEMANYKDAAAAQRDLKIAFMGIEQTLTNDVLPALTPVIQDFGKLLRAARPLMHLIVPLTAGLWLFSGAVKGVRLVQFITGLGRSEKAAQGLFTVLRNGQALSVARTGFSKLAGVVRGLPALLSSTGGMYTMIAAGIAVDSYLIYEAVKAWQAMRDAIDQAREAAANARAELAQAVESGNAAQWQNLPGYNPQTMSPGAIQQAIERDQFKYSWWMGPGGWLENAGINIPGLANEGLVKARPGGTIARLAEAGEDEVVLKASRLKGGKANAGPRELHLHFHGTVVGGKAGLREFARDVRRELQRDVRFA